jgi:hypothetical protein
LAQSGSPGEDAKEQTKMVARKASPWLVWFVRAGYAAYKAGFREELKLHEMSGREKTWATRSGRLGYAARGVDFGVIGVFLMQADPDKARGLGGALQAPVLQPLGPYLLGTVALGLVAYGAFMLVVARYRRIEPS